MNKAMGLGFTLGLTILAYGLIGRLLDKLFHTGSNVLMVIGFFVGTIVSFAYMIYSLNKNG